MSASTAELLLGVLGLNAILLAVGYAVLAVALRGTRPAVWASYAGVALLTGVVAIGVALTWAASAGAVVDLSAFLVAVCVTVVLGVAASVLVPERLRARLAPPTGAVAGMGRKGALLATAAAFGVVAVCAFGLVGGFRSSPWLDDTWFFWIPRGVVLGQSGLDERMFAPTDVYYGYDNPYYPLLWSIVSALDLRFVGTLDLRAVNGQLALLVVAFVASVGRLLWGVVRPVILWPGLLLLVASPALFRQAQGGGVDLPLAFFIVVSVLAAAGWLVYRRPFALLLLFIGAAGALAAKREGLPQIVLFLAVVSLLAPAGPERPLRALGAMWATVAGAVATALPWVAWQWAHDALADPITDAAANPERAFDRGAQGRAAIDQLLDWSTRPGEWLVVLPLFFTLALAGLVRERRAAWLVPLLLVFGGYAFWFWFFLTDPYNTVASAPIAYRTVTPLLVMSAVLVPLLAERLLRTRAVPRTRAAALPEPARSRSRARA